MHELESLIDSKAMSEIDNRANDGKNSPYNRFL